MQSKKIPPQLIERILDGRKQWIFFLVETENKMKKKTKALISTSCFQVDSLNSFSMKFCVFTYHSSVCFFYRQNDDHIDDRIACFYFASVSKYRRLLKIESTMIRYRIARRTKLFRCTESALERWKKNSWTRHKLESFDRHRYVHIWNVMCFCGHSIVSVLDLTLQTHNEAMRANFQLQRSNTIRVKGMQRQRRNLFLKKYAYTQSHNSKIIIENWEKNASIELRKSEVKRSFFIIHINLEKRAKTQTMKRNR